jgi:hypothetical protein
MGWDGNGDSWVGEDEMDGGTTVPSQDLEHWAATDGELDSVYKIIFYSLDVPLARRISKPEKAARPDKSSRSRSRSGLNQLATVPPVT